MEATFGAGMVARAGRARFHLWMAIVFAVIAFGGFVPTYWSPVTRGTFEAPPIVHVHGVLLFSWTLLYLVQTALVNRGRIANHRAWGLFGISLFSVMVFSMLATRIVMMQIEQRQGIGESSLHFSAITFCFIPLLVAYFALAIRNIAKPEAHKRYLYLIMCGLMVPALARLYMVMLAPPPAPGDAADLPPTFVIIPPLLTASLLIVVALVYDWRTRGRPHPVYSVGGLVLVAYSLLIVPFSGTTVWLAIARSLRALGA